jgi:uncharacterized RDD family membrane protein YckC
MDFDDVLTITTPEGVDLQLVLAGVGSRFGAALIDLIIQIVLIAAITVAFDTAGILSGWGTLVYITVLFVVVFGYDIAFEVLSSGRTPGKRLNGLRVVRDGGFPVGFVSSAIRNTLRLVDFLPTSYIVGCAAILITERNQRLGDLAAGTLVVRERRAASSAPAPRPQQFDRAHPTWDVGTITAEELLTVRRFLDRRDAIDATARAQLAHTLAERLRPKVGGAPSDLRGERFLEAVVAAKSSRGGI